MKQTVTENRISHRILKNVAFNALSRTWFILIGFFLPPLILSYIGDERFAIWALFWTFSQYFLLLDFGLGASLVKHFADFKAREDNESINQMVTRMLFFYTGLGGFTIILLWHVIEPIVGFLNIPDGMVNEAIYTFRGGIVIFLIINLVSLFDSLMKGFQRMDITNLVLITCSIPNLGLSYFVLKMGYGLLGLIFISAMIYILQLVSLIMATKVVFPQFSLNFKPFRDKTFKSLLNFGFRFQLFRLSELVSYQTDKVLLGIFTPIQYVTFYDLGSKISALMRDFPYFMLTPLFPAASELAGMKDKERLWRLYERGTKYLFLLTTPLLLGVLLTGHLILKAWLGYVSPAVYLAVIMLSIGYWMVINNGIVFNVGAGMGWVNPLVHNALLQIALNLCLSLAMILLFGYPGILVGTTISLIICNCYLFLRFCRDFNRSVSDHLNLLKNIFLINLLPCIISFGYIMAISNWVSAGDRRHAFTALISCVLLYAGIYLIMIRKSGIIDYNDRELLRNYMPFLSRLLGSKHDLRPPTENS